jgi:hypothetical protein
MMIVLFGIGAKAQLLAVKTNALYWAGLSPNASIEMVTKSRISVEVGAFGNNKPYGYDLKMTGFQPQVKYWFNGRPMTREFVGLGIIGATYHWDEHGINHKGDALGLGLTFGYALKITPRINVEFTAGAGQIYFHELRKTYDDDKWTTNPDVEKAETLTGMVDEDKYGDHYQGWNFMPFNLGVHFVYILK